MKVLWVSSKDLKSRICIDEDGLMFPQMKSGNKWYDFGDGCIDGITSDCINEMIEKIKDLEEEVSELKNSIWETEMGEDL